MLITFSKLHERQTKSPALLMAKDEKIRTLQSFKKDADINFIMKKYRETGLLPVPQNRQPFYGDFTKAGDFMSNLNKIILAKKYFLKLPASTREFFNNDPSTMLDWLVDEKNNDKAVELGLRPKPAVPEKPAEQSPAGPVAT